MATRKNRIEINNTNKTLIISNLVFETLTAEEEAKISKYEAIGYKLSIVDNVKKTVSSIVKLTDTAIRYALAENSYELGLNKKQSVEYTGMYEHIFGKKGFQTAKKFYLELLAVKEQKKGARESYEKVMEYYTGVYKNFVPTSVAAN